MSNTNHHLTLKSFLEQHDIEPNNIDIYFTAVKHSSYTRIERDNYEQLEFLGDAILQFLSSSYIFKKYPTLTQGYQTRLRSKAVCTKTLSEITNQLGLLDLLKTGPGKMRDTVISSQKVQADLFESLTGAIYIDQGLQKTYDFVKQYVFPLIDDVHNEENKDPKGRLQEYFQSISKENITYVTEWDEKREQFYSKAKHDNQFYGQGFGLSKKEAEVNAATDALEKLKVNEQ
ncbi:ribonuclease III [Mycoplasma sp. Pen4]|uniref:ribonuclease III n=1 Tax=Mycoplasma sp. Pen4 TaxID=640330 RepID=UPI0016543480|nr:ribonuclease III [Mycoplasma sp. Pen4]QNM93944.1 ribonuclease III [Mycoplasma sp. Pen4]